MFDTLKYTRELEKLGFNKNHAEKLINLLRDIMKYDLATKTDLFDIRNEIKDVYNELKADIQDVRNELKADIQDVRNELKSDIQELRNEIKIIEFKLTVKMGCMFILASSVIIGVLGFLIKT